MTSAVPSGSVPNAFEKLPLHKIELSNMYWLRKLDTTMSPELPQISALQQIRRVFLLVLKAFLFVLLSDCVDFSFFKQNKYIATLFFPVLYAVGQALESVT